MLFLSASVGVGHTAAANAVSVVLRERGWDVHVVDSYKYAASVFSKVVADGYIGMVKTIPQMYRFIYDRAERASGAGAFRRWVSQFTAQNLRALIAELQPAAVVCTHAFPCGVMAEYKKSIDPELPVAGVVTDFVVHPYWIYRNVDAYAVATAEMRNTLVGRGIGRERVTVSGIPVDPRFALVPSRSASRAELGLWGDRKLALVMGGGLGIGPLEMMLRGLESVEGEVAAVVIVGKNARRERKLREWVTRLSYPVEVHGFVDNVFDYMHAADVLLSKPGGLSCSEALVARLPLVLVKPLPGQEERNTRYLVERGAALRAGSEKTLARAADVLLGDPTRRARLIDGVDRLRRPEAAADVAAVVEHLALRGARVPAGV